MKYRHFFGKGICLLSLVVLAGCSSSGDSGNLISADLDFSDYLKIQQPKHGQARIVFPLMEIYDETGRTLYSGSDSAENAKALQELPAPAADANQADATNTVADYVNKVPAFKSRQAHILQGHRRIVLSVVLNGCHACASQEAAVEQAIASGDQSQAVQYLVLHVSQPS